MLRNVFLITGASRGLGLELVKQLCNCDKSLNRLKPSSILATCRNPEKALELQEVSKSNAEKVIIKKLDVADFASYSEFVKTIEPIVEKTGINCLINNAGISPKSTRYTMVNVEQMADTFKTNAIAPLMFSREMLPFLKKAADNNSIESLIVNMSSILGSVELNHPESGGGSGGGIYPYRSSKAALNMITRSLSLDLKHINTKAVAIHPGWVKTDMGGSHAPLTTEQSIFGVLSVINNFSSESHNGKLIDYTGKILPF